MRRRRLALRQIAETTQDVSDIDGDDSDEQQQQTADEPTFNLLTVTTGAGPEPSAILLSDDDDHELARAMANQPQQHARRAVAVSVRPSPKRSAATKQLQSGRAGAGANAMTTASDGSTSIFSLYQEGLAPDQVLQLAFTRRRAPRSLRAKNDESGTAFVLPIPSLSIRELLPPVDVDMRDLFASNVLPATASDHTSESASPTTQSHGATREPIASAAKFFFTPQDASREQRRSWQTIAEREWKQLYQELQTALPAAQRPKTPSADTVCALLRDCQSDAFADFVWSSLFVPVLEEESAALAMGDSRTHELVTLLLRQRRFRAMAPKHFRAEVRAKQLRQQLSDVEYGARVELLLLQVYHSNRQDGRQT